MCLIHKLGLNPEKTNADILKKKNVLLTYTCTLNVHHLGRIRTGQNPDRTGTENNGLYETVWKLSHYI